MLSNQEHLNYYNGRFLQMLTFMFLKYNTLFYETLMPVIANMVSK